jgi:splicing factor 1
LEDLTRRLLTSDFENVDPDLRSPSPEPVYDSKSGLRLNTRDVRAKENYIKEKNSIIEELISLDETYKPPQDYKPPKKTKKLMIPDSDSANFVGLILGPSGQSQRELEKKSGCKISIRGKGSNWVNIKKFF